MCGRYGLYDISEADILLENKGYSFKPNYNVAPSQAMPVVLPDYKVEQMIWGIHRVIGPNIEKDIINTRADKAFGRFWGKSVREKRCLIPANGFYEWRKENGRKIPYWIHPKDRSIFMFAGVYSEDDMGLKHFSIMTTDPNEEMKEIHDRMPVILHLDNEKFWLNDDLKEDDIISSMLKPYPDSSLDIYEVSTEVNLVRNNKQELTYPINSA